MSSNITGPWPRPILGMSRLRFRSLGTPRFVVHGAIPIPRGDLPGIELLPGPSMHMSPTVPPDKEVSLELSNESRLDLKSSQIPAEIPPPPPFAPPGVITGTAVDGVDIGPIEAPPIPPAPRYFRQKSW